MCSWCSRFRLVGDHWVEAETAVDALGIFQTSTVPDVTHGMCPDCYATITRALEASLEVPEPE
jgi:hypothetical protein